MKFSIEDFNLDLGETPIENLFIDLMLPIANGDAIKVYLYLYRQVLKNKNNFEYEEDTISKDLGMSIDEFKRSLEYWLEVGIISRELIVETGKYSYKFLSIRELQLGAKPFYEYNRNEERFLNKNNNQEMFDKIEEILEIPLTNTNIMEILELQQMTKMESDLIVKGFEYSKSKTGKMNFNYVFGILRNWYLDGIITITDFYNRIENDKVKKANIRKKRKYYKPKSNEEKKLDIDFKENSAELESIRKLIAEREKNE